MDRFSIVYRIAGPENEAWAKAQDICLEQTVEFPAELLPEGYIQNSLIGQITEFVPDGTEGYKATISFAIESAAHELTQLLNVIFGNISIKPGYRVEAIELPDALLQQFRGPRWGKAGLREILKVKPRPLLFTALKPMGLSSQDLAELAYQFALGGIDIIKDDHGLTNQRYAPFQERVRLCAEAVARANKQTGLNCIYTANVTAPHHEVLSRARYAKENGAGGLLVAPGLVGFDTMRSLAEDDNIALPIFSHPAFLGSYVLGTDNGISHFALFGQITRLAGADGIIYPNYGGRFSFSRQECQSIARGAAAPMGNLKTSFPCPGGGMNMSNIPDMIEVYGADVIFLVGGGLFKHGPNLIDNCNYFRSLVEVVA
ncbi:MAG: RuBisCO large subunit C-terminal-like domain-containing protein [Syntrophomonadaceae bacterium]|nr:RuBisCO large subunit C-terminal-like domain-containing protein [Syntrophomonadaceae bacterium]